MKWGGLLLCMVACAPVDGPPFIDKASDWGIEQSHVGGGAEKRYIVEAKGGGAALLDADGDGDLDIYWVNGEGGDNALYRNDRDRGFVDIAVAAGVSGHGWGMGALSADYDGDGDADLYITCLQEKHPLSQRRTST